MLYFLTFIMAFAITSILLPPCRKFLSSYLTDIPTSLKNHAAPTPLVGGLALALGFFTSLLIIRFTTDFPTGTLNSLRGIFYGGAIVFTLGLIDDIKKPQGLSPYIKLMFQALAAFILIAYNIRAEFTVSAAISYLITIFWVIGITNAFNLIDIMDGLAISQTVLAAGAFLFISLPSEHIYVNFAAAALLGAAIGFWPYNHLAKLKTFLGDSGSTLLGFILAALALGTRYSEITPLAVFAPLLILALPLFDTCFVSALRIKRGVSPLQGGPDHFPIKLGLLGFKKPSILLLSMVVTLIFDILAYFVTKTTTAAALFIYISVFCLLLSFAVYLERKTQ